MTHKIVPHELEPWRLFLTSHARLIAHFEARMAAANQISLHWYDVLIELYEAPERRLRMKEIADRIVLSPSGLTRLVDNLEKAGLLTRASDPTDRRVIYAILTEAGIDTMRGAWAVYAELIREYFLEALDNEEAEILVRVFRRILDRLPSG